MITVSVILATMGRASKKGISQNTVAFHEVDVNLSSQIMNSSCQ